MHHDKTIDIVVLHELIGIGLFVFDNRVRWRNCEEELTKYYSRRHIAVLAENNRRELAHAKRDLFALVDVMRDC